MLMIPLTSLALVFAPVRVRVMPALVAPPVTGPPIFKTLPMRSDALLKL